MEEDTHMKQEEDMYPEEEEGPSQQQRIRKNTMHATTVDSVGSTC